jgi:hypothetical protein
MVLKKTFIGIFLLGMLSGCAQNAALLGPAYTFGSTGNIYQAGLTFGSNKAISSLTGKSAGQNIKEILTSKKKDSKFEKLVKTRIIETRKKIKLANQ